MPKLPLTKKAILKAKSYKHKLAIKVIRTLKPKAPEPETKIIHTSTTGRTGTKYLTELINTNTTNATSEHEPYPPSYGEPIQKYDQGDTEYLRAHSICKLVRIQRGEYGEQAKTRLSYTKPSVPIKEIYLDSSHSFNKSYGEEMLKLKPDIGIIHLKRNPLETAKSFQNRGSIPKTNNPYLLHPSMKRTVLKIDPVQTVQLTDFQLCLWYVYETEERHKQIIKKHKPDTYDIQTKELDKTEKVKEMFEHFGIKYREPIKHALNRNRNRIPTRIKKQDKKEAKQLEEIIQ